MRMINHLMYFKKRKQPLVQIWIFLFFFAQAFGVSGQQENIKEKEVDSLLSTAWSYRHKNSDVAFEITQKAIDKAKKAKYKKGVGEGFNYLGIILRNQNKFTEAQSNFEKSLLIRTELKDTLGIGAVLNNLGTLKKEIGDYDKSIAYLIEAVKIYEAFNRPDKLAISYNNIANTYDHAELYNQAIDYNERSINILVELKDTLALADAKYNLASKFFWIGDYKAANANLQDALRLFRKIGNWRKETYALDVMAQVATEQGNFDQALEYYDSAIKLYQINEVDDADLSVLHLNSAALQNEIGNYIEAYRLLKLAEKHLNISGLEDKWLYYVNLADSQAGMGNYDSAFFFQAQATALQDTIYNAESAEAIAEMQTKYETEKTERELAEEKLVSQKIQFQKNIFIGLFSAAAILAVFSYLHFTQKQKATRTIAQQKERIHQQEVQELLKTQELTAINSMLEGQENERIRIAKDLHDRLGSMLTTVKWNFDAYMEKQTPEQDADPLLKASGMLDDAYQEVRRIAHNMVSGVLTKFGLVPALQELARSISTSGKMQVKVISSGLGDRLDNKVEIILYRVVQELLSNILKHANATEAIIQLTRLNGELNISVEDNGKGFDPEKIKYGMGIKNMEARVQALDGSFFIDSGKGNGTTVMIDLPV